MKNKIKHLIVASLLSIFAMNAQQDHQVEKIWRINFINPSVEIELPTGELSSFSAGLGVGYGGAYPELTIGSPNGFVYIIAPILDLQQKWYYNFNKRIKKNKNVIGNSGNFFSFRLVTRGPSIADNINRTSDFDFAIGPTWGLQRRYGKSFHLLFDFGPQYYFDTEGNGGVFPINAQLNLGIDLN